MMAPRHGRVRAALVLGAALAAGLPQMAFAQSDEQAFQGKVINLYIGFAPGGTYDYFGRMVARYIGKHIPGNPTVVAQTMQGAGSLQAANFIYAQAPKDGTAWAVVTQTVALEEALRSPGVHYKAAEFTWLGRMTSIREVYFTWKTSKAKTLEDARAHETPMAGTGSGSPSEGYPKLLNALAGTQIQDHLRLSRLDPGHAGDGARRGRRRIDLLEYDQAHQAGMDTRIAISTSWCNLGFERHPELPDVPTLLEAANTPEGRQIMEFYVSGAEVGRSLLASPGIPGDRVKILRTAFDAMVKDPEFLAEIEKSGQEFQPASGEQMQKLIAAAALAPREIVERTEAILRAK